MVTNLPFQLVQSQQRTVLRPQLATASTPMMAVRNQVPARIIVGQHQVQLKELQPGEVWGQPAASACAGSGFHRAATLGFQFKLYFSVSFLFVLQFPWDQMGLLSLNKSSLQPWPRLRGTSWRRRGALSSRLYCCFLQIKQYPSCWNEMRCL